MISSSGRRALILLLFTSALAAGQAAPTSGAGGQKEAEDLLRQIDSRIYYARNEGLKDVRFRWQLGGTGIFEELSKVWIDYAWKAPDKWRMQWVDAEGKPIQELPAFAKTEEGRNLFENQRTQLHSMAQTVMIGLPLSQIYKDYLKEVKSLEVNNKIEHRIIMRPQSKKAFTRVVIHVRDGLPREFVKTDEKGAELTSRVRFEARGDKWLCVGVKVEVQNQVVQDEDYHYSTHDGVLVLTENVIGVAQGEKRRYTVRMEDLKVNSGLPDSLFDAK